jgi:molecular chaperone HtpG
MTATKKARKPAKPDAKRSASQSPQSPEHSKPESHAFQAEVAKLLQLMVHSVYAEREVFLRELISNGADALDKLRYEALTRPELLEGGGDLKLTISSDPKAKTLTVADTGIGMSRDEMIDNLGTIARSGTQKFIEKVNAGEGDLKLIGQFGIGFYSAFMVADKVEVISRRAGADETSLWSSDGSGTFEVAPYEGDDAPQRGTVIRLHMRDDTAEFLESWRLEQIVRTYSDHVAHPIMLALESDTARQINSGSAIWTRAKSDITPEQYKEFFSHLAGLQGDPALTIHYKAEGRTEYTVLLFVPGEQPFDLYDPERRGRQKLYVRRVFITEDADLLPGYLRFVRGVIDSEDMPLNISREMLQNNATVAQIRKSVTGKVLGELKKCAENEPETYAKLWQSFGPVLKEGLYEDMERRDQLFDIVRFRTTNSDAETVSLKDYVSRLRDNQTAIYYLTGEDAAKAAASPQIEGYRARDIEVLLLTDPVDSFWVRTALGFEGKPFRSVTQGAADLDAIPVTGEAKEEAGDDGAIGTLIAAMKQSLGDSVKEVRRSKRLTESPVCLVAGEEGLDRTLEKLLARQKTCGVEVSSAVLEVNPKHPLIVALAGKAKAGGAIGEIEEATRLLYDQAHILDGDLPADPQAFARRMTKLMTSAMTGGHDRRRARLTSLR